MPTREDAIRFYGKNYDLLGSWLLKPGEKIMLGDKENRVCRFCGRTKPEVQFRKDAHAVSEMLGNKTLFTAYECDTCNGDFGKGIEQDLGNWSKPMRTMAAARILSHHHGVRRDCFKEVRRYSGRAAGLDRAACRRTCFI